MTVRLLLFGSPTVEYGGESLALPFERRNQLLVFLALKRAWVGRARTGGTALARAGKQARLHQPSQDAASIAVAALGARDRVAGGCASVRSRDRRVRLSTRRCASSDSPMRCRCVAASCSPDLTTIRAKHGQAGSASSAIACDVAWRDAALSRLAAEIDIGGSNRSVGAAARRRPAR